jgi:hypothetical protein
MLGELLKCKNIKDKKIFEKILSDNEKAERIKQEREGLLVARRDMRQEIDKNKRELLENFDKMKKSKMESTSQYNGSKSGEYGSGVMKPSRISKSPEMRSPNMARSPQMSSTRLAPKTAENRQRARRLQSPTEANRTADNHHNSARDNKPQLTDKEAKKLIENLKISQNHEMLMILEEEQNNEGEREQKLRGVVDSQERRRLEKIFGMERAKAHARIQALADQHDEGVRDLMVQYSRLMILVSSFGKNWIDHSKFENNINFAKFNRFNSVDDAEYNQSKSSSTDFDHGHDDYSSSNNLNGNSFNHVLRIGHSPDEKQTRSKRSSRIKSNSTGSMSLLNQMGSSGVFLEQDDKSPLDKKSFNLNIYDHKLKHYHFSDKKNCLANTSLKLQEYNQINNDFILKKNLFSNVYFNKYYAVNFTALPKFSMTSHYTSTRVPETFKFPKPSKSKLCKKKAALFKPTELSTIYENLAY